MPITDTFSDENEDHSLLASASAGDPNALDQLIANQMSWLQQVIQQKRSNNNRWLSDEDILQNTLTKVVVNFGEAKFDSLLEFKRWLALLAEHSIVDAARWQGRKKRGGGFRQVVGNADSEESIVALLEDLGLETPSRIAIGEENKREIDAALATLPSNERVVIELYYFEKLTGQEVADQMGLTLGQVSQIRRHACRKLHNVLGRSSLYVNKRVPRVR